MWSSSTKTVCSFFLALFYVISLTALCEGKMDTQLCLEDSNAIDELTFTCTCPSVNDVMIIQDKYISYGNKQIVIPNNTKHWRIGECSAVHLSGPTLISLKNIYTLQLHHIDQIHISYDFFIQFNTPLQMLHVSHSKFVAPEGSFNIHAHKLKTLVLDSIIWNGNLNLLILTQEDQYLDLIAIKRCNIEAIGEINISPKYVHTFVLEDNNIGNIFTGAILHDSHKINIQNNYIDHLNFLSLEANTYNFTFQGNIVSFLSLESLVVDNATNIQVTKNSFFHIETFAFTWLRLRSENGSMIFSDNQFHNHEPGSLVFYFAVYNEKLVIKNNIVETTICNCSTGRLIKHMTEANDKIPSFKQNTDMALKLFTKSSFCRNEEGKQSPISSLCENNESNESWSWELPAIIAVIIIICGLLMIGLVKQHIYNKKYIRLSTDTKIITPFIEPSFINK